MPTLVLFGLVAVLLWSLVSHRFERWGVAGPAMLLLLGAATTIWDLPTYAAALNAPLTEKIVEVILSILLFADATEVRGGIFGGEGRITARLVLIALPLSLLLTAIASALLIPESFAVIGVIACVVMPTDFAPAAGLLRTRLLPERIRRDPERGERLQRRPGLADLRHGAAHRRGARAAGAHLPLDRIRHSHGERQGPSGTTPTRWPRRSSTPCPPRSGPS